MANSFLDYLTMAAVIVGLVVAVRALAWIARRGRPAQRRSVAKTPGSTNLWARRPAPGDQGGNTFAWPALGEFEAQVAGESHYQKTLKSLAGAHGDEAVNLRTSAMLVPDDANPHDRNAVRVEIKGKLVGFLPREDAKRYRARLKTQKVACGPATCGAIVMGGFIRKDGTRASYGARLDIEPFD